MQSLSASYSEMIRWALSNRGAVTVFAVGLFACAMWLSGYVGVELEPQVDEGQIRINIESEPGTRAEVTKEIVDRMEAIIMDQVPEQTTSWTKQAATAPSRSISTHVGELRITLATSPSEPDQPARSPTC